MSYPNIYQPDQRIVLLITIKHTHVVTSIKQSHLLNNHISNFYHRALYMNWTYFKRSPMFIPKEDLLIHVYCNSVYSLINNWYITLLWYGYPFNDWHIHNLHWLILGWGHLVTFNICPLSIFSSSDYTLVFSNIS